MSEAGWLDLEGIRVLVVEDEPIVAMMLEDMLSDLGMIVLGPEVSLKDGLLAARDKIFDVAVLDMNLNGQRSDPIADLLTANAVPFIFATGYDLHELRHGNVELIEKPYRQDQLVAALARALMQTTLRPPIGR